MKHQVPDALPAIWVYWRDIVMDGHDQWLEHDAEPLRPIGIQTIGFLLEETEDELVIVAHWCDDKQRGHRTAIPKGTILARRDVGAGPAVTEKGRGKA